MSNKTFFGLVLILLSLALLLATNTWLFFLTGAIGIVIAFLGKPYKDGDGLWLWAAMLAFASVRYMCKAANDPNLFSQQIDGWTAVISILLAMYLLFHAVNHIPKNSGDVVGVS